MGKGTNNHPASPAAKGERVKKVTVRVLAVLVCLCVLSAMLWGVGATTGILQRSITMMTVGGTDISTLEFQMYYRDALSNLMSTYGSYFQQLGYNISTIENQSADGNLTWGQTLHNNTVSQLTELYTLYGEAKAAGYVMDDFARARADAYIASIASIAQENDMMTAKFIKTVYGNYVKESDLLEITERRFTALGYYQQLKDGIQVSDTDISSYYDEHKDDFDGVSYRYFNFPYKTVTYTAPADGKQPAAGDPTSAEDATKMTEANKAEAKKLADDMLAGITDEASFITLARKNASAEDAEKYADDNATLIEGAKVASASGALAEWYTEADRKTGDTAVIDNGNGYTVIYYLSRGRSEDPTVNVRHILIQTQEASDTATDEEKAAIEKANAEAKTKAEKLLADFKAGEATEQAFALLAVKNSTDTGSSSQGGLYENVYSGQMVPEFDAWIFDSARRTGDVDIVPTEYGYHIIYFVGNGPARWQGEVRDTLIDNKYNEWKTETSVKYPATVNSFASKMF